MGAPKGRPNIRSIRRRQVMKKRLKVQGSKDDVSVNSVASSTTIAGSLASTLNVGMISVVDETKQYDCQLR